MTDSVAFPQDRTCPYEPAPGYRPLAQRRPLSRITLFNGREAWAVTGAALTRGLLTDPRLSNDRNDPEWAAASAMAAAAATFSDAQKRTLKRLTALVAVDGPEHRARRGLVEAGLPDALTESLRPRLQEIVDRQLDEMIAGGAPADLVEAFAMPVPLLALHALLGIPDEDHDYFERQSRLIMMGPDIDAAWDEFVAYVGTLIGKRQHGGGESFLDTLIAARGITADADAEETLQLLLTVVLSGHHATANTIAVGVFALLRHPDLLAGLRADPSQLPAATDELTRLTSVIDGLQRLATEDIEVDGTTIRRGDGVFFPLSLVNRDEEHVARPDVLDWDRPSVHDHLAYGFGPHRCPATGFANAVMEIAYRRLFERLPNLRLAVAADEVPVKPGEAFQGLVKLPVTW